ncbi:MAG: FAD-dependent oxidoreductase [Gammaproteobacteria bacterium]|nr:FAD-dependent oxidoreductase [Gammaproteobacteria bacterium]
MTRALIIGGGWSGLAAAVELCRQQIEVTLVEAAGRLGGRAARIQHRGREYDSGQHLVIGAYHGILGLLAAMGVSEDAVFERRPFEMVSLSVRSAPPLSFRLVDLPAPFHLLGGLFGAEGLSRADKWGALRFCLAAARSKDLREDFTVQELMYRHGQSPESVSRLWEPICLATLNTPLHEASAEIFLRVLRDVFAYDRRDSDLLLPRRGLAGMFPEPAQKYIEGRGGRILLNSRATRLEISRGMATGAMLADGTRLDADHVILALPPPACLHLIEGCVPMRLLAQRLTGFDYAPICTVYLRYSSDVRLDFPMVGLHGTLAQWAFDLSSSGEPGLIAAVISGPGEHMELERGVLQQRIVAELATCFPHWPAPEEIFTLCEKRATFLSRQGINSQRPGVETPVEACWLAGDAVATGYPSTLEGAVRSGMECARRVVAQSARRA